MKSIYIAHMSSYVLQVTFFSKEKLATDVFKIAVESWKRNDLHGKTGADREDRTTQEKDRKTRGESHDSLSDNTHMAFSAIPAQ